MRVIDYFFLCGFSLCDDSVPVLWKTIEGGLSTLPESCAQAILEQGGSIQLNTRIESISCVTENGSIKMGYFESDNLDMVYETFDKVILTIPPACIRSIPERWDPDLENALRTAPSLPAVKLGLRFHTRFWERPDLKLPGSKGSISTTDLPIRWVIYPSYGIGSQGKGVLHVYIREGDTTLDEHV